MIEHMFSNIISNGISDSAHKWAIYIASSFLLTTMSNVFSNAFHIYQAEIFPIRAQRSGRLTASAPYQCCHSLHFSC